MGLDLGKTSTWCQDPLHYVEINDMKIYGWDTMQNSCHRLGCRYIGEMIEFTWIDFFRLTFCKTGDLKPAVISLQACAGLMLLMNAIGRWSC